MKDFCSFNFSFDAHFHMCYRMNEQVDACNSPFLRFQFHNVEEVFFFVVEIRDLYLQSLKYLGILIPYLHYLFAHIKLIIKCSCYKVQSQFGKIVFPYSFKKTNGDLNSWEFISIIKYDFCRLGVVPLKLGFLLTRRSKLFSRITLSIFSKHDPDQALCQILLVSLGYPCHELHSVREVTH